MLRLWREIHEQRMPVSTSALISVVTHVVLVTAAVAATRRPAGVEVTSELANRPYYIPPPNREPGQRQTVEHLQFIALAPAGFGVGFGRANLDVQKKAQVLGTTPTPGDVGRDTLSEARHRAVASTDSVLTEVEVDSAARRDPNSAAPSYPAELLKTGVEGSVAAQYVVDTNGLADVATLRILRTSHPLFSDAVRTALPFMRFEAAKLGGRKVRQLVEQEFSFHIEPPKVTDTAKKP